MASHQMTLNDKRDDFTMDVKACAKAASMKHGRAESIVNEVGKTVSRWKDYAEEAGVPVSVCDQIQRTLRLELGNTNQDKTFPLYFLLNI